MGYLLCARQSYRYSAHFFLEPHLESEVGDDTPIFHLMEQAQR